MSKKVFAVLAALVVLGAAGVYYYVLRPGRSAHGVRVLTYLRNPEKYSAWEVKAGERCAGAVFSFPTSGFIGYVWDDSFRPGHRHSGLDIFGGTDINVTPVVAAYDGYLTRLSDWKSSVIIRIPSDPLHPGRQIWTYYTHMADEAGNSYISPEFPPGTAEVFVPAGTLLGYQGDYSGDPLNPVGVHLHFSIVKDDGTGAFTNETAITNTYDPSPYFNLRLNSKDHPDEIPVCSTP